MTNIADARKKIPELAGLDDQQAVDVIHQAYYPQLDRSVVAQRLGVGAPAAAGEGSSLLRRVAGDSAVSLMKGAVAVPEAIVGLGDLVTGGRAGKLAEEAGFRPKEAKQILEEFYSPEQRAANAKVSQADGIVDTLATALENPSTIGHAILESAPSLLPAGAAARGLLAVAPRVGGAIAAGVGEGLVSAGQTAEQVRQETTDGLLTGEQAGLAAGSGALTGLLGAVAGKVANRLGIGDVNQLVAGVRNAGPEVEKGVVRKLVEGFASEGLLQEFPQSAQEQVAQNLALGKPWDEGVGNAATMGALAGGAMGAGAAPFGHTGAGAPPIAAPSPADEIRSTKVPETGVLTKSINSGIEAQAAAVEANAKPLDRFGFMTEQRATEFAQRYHPDWKVAQKADGTWSFVEPSPLATEPGAPGGGAGAETSDVSSSFDQRLKALREDLGGEGTMDAMREQFGRTGASDVLQALGALDQGGLPARTRERMLTGLEQRLAALRMSVLEEQGGAAQPALGAPEQLQQLAMAPAAPQILFDQSPTGVIRVDAQGNAAPETAANLIDERNAAAAAQQVARERVALGEQAPLGPREAPVPLALEFDSAPTGRLIADEQGQVRQEVRAEEINRAQAADAAAQTAAAKAEIGLTPDVELASMRRAMGTATQAGDVLTADGLPFRNRRAAQAAVARAEPGYQVVELSPDNFVGRRSQESGTAPASQAGPAVAEEAPRAVPEIRAGNGQVFKSERVANARAAQNPGYAVVAVDDGWVLRKPAADMAGEQLTKDWTAFAEDAGSRNVPRAEMPQVKAEHRGALVNFLTARGIPHEQGDVPANILKPTQTEYSPGKVEQAKGFTGGDRSILVSSDGHVLDGHHQWLAARDAGGNIKTIVFDAPIEQLLREVKEFPSSTVADGATPAAPGQADMLLSRQRAEKVDDSELARRAQAVQQFVEAVQNNAPHDPSMVVGQLGDDAAAKITEALGMPAEGAVEVVVADSVIHAMKQHPDLKAADWGRLPFLTNQFDEAAPGAKARNPALKRVMLRMTDGGTNYGGVFELSAGGRRNARRLNLVTFFTGTDAQIDAWWAKGKGRDVASVPSSTELASSAPGELSQPSGESLTSRPVNVQPGVGIKADEIRRGLDPVMKNWTNGPAGGVKVLQSFHEFPANIQEGLKALNAEGIVRALFMPRDQSVYLLADNLKSVEEAQFALFHEVYGHLGLRGLMSKGAFEETLIRVQRSNPGLQAEADRWFASHGMDEVQARVARGMKNNVAMREVALLAVEEALADRAGKNVPISGLKYLLARIQKALRAIGLEHVADWMEARSDAEVLDLLRRARESVLAEARPWEGGAQAAPAMSAKDAGPVLSRSPGQAVADMTPQVIKDMVEGQRSFRKVHWWHKSVGTMYDLAAKHPAFRRVFESAQDFIRDTSRFANDAGDQAPRVLPQLNDWGDFGKSLSLSDADRKAIAAPIFEGTLQWARDDAGQLIEAKDVESAGVVFTDQELRDRFKLDDKQIELYREFRAAVDRSLDSTAATDVLRYMGKEASDGMKGLAREGQFRALRDVVTQHIEGMEPGKLRDAMQQEVKEKFEKLDHLKASGYAPLMRFGKYAVRVTEKKSGKSLFFSLYESSTEAARAARELKEEFPNEWISRGTMSQEEFKLLKGVSPETLGLFARISGTDQSEAVQLWLKQAVSNRSALKRMIKRKGIQGYSEDVTRVLSNFITSNARAASQALHFGEMQELVSEINDGDVKDAAERLRQYLQNPVEEAAALRGFLFTHFIGGSIASAAVNMTQPFLMTMPYLSQFVGIAGAGKVLGKLTSAAATGKIADEDMRTAVHLAEQEGIVAPQELHQLQAMAMGRGTIFGNAARFLGASDKIATAADTAGKRAMFIWGAPFALAEQFNRRLTFMAAYQVAKDKKMEDPFKFAAQAVIETQGLYNKANRPEWARGAIGATLFTFKQYSISYLEFMQRMWTAGEPGSEARENGRKAALFGLALLIMAAGASGLPGADDLDDVIATVGQRMGFDTSAKGWKQEHLPAWLNYGFSALPGIPLDVAGRLGIGNLIPGTGLLRKDKGDKSGDVLEVAGPAGAVAKNIVTAVDSGSLAPMLPTAIANAMKGVDIAQHGAYRDTKGRTVIEADMGDAVTKFIGFQPATVAAASRSDGIQIGRQALARNVESEIAGDWAAARFEGDLEGEQAARQRLADWNAKNPDTPIGITMGQIQKRVQQMRQTRVQRLQKSATKEIRAADARAGAG